MEDTVAWTEITRAQYRREGLRYASDLTDAEWALIEPFMPPPAKLGRPRETDMREVVEAILYMASTGCQWRAIPREFPPYSTVQSYFYAWSHGGLLAQINHVLVMALREKVGREASPTARVIDSQSVKTTEAGGPRGFDAGKKIKGRKRHIVTDTEGNLVGLQVHAADIQDRDGAVDVLASIRALCPWLRHVFADAAMPATSCATRWPASANGPSRSSNGPTPPRASSSCHDAGWSSAPSAGSDDAAASPRTLRPRSKASSPGFSTLISDG